MLDQDKDEQTIFQTAVRLANPAERKAYVQQACGDNPALLARVTLLLQAHGAEQAILDALIPVHDLDIDDSGVSEGPGTVIGRYKLLEKIGEGGMAVVYMAEQEQPLRRKAALKIIKLGMDTRQVIARFEAERQVLALMDHPSIAKVFDAGATETGRPYFVMELVQGVSITEYCDKNSLSTKDRLALFLQVCHAVQHAHQKGIIHRDIKPSNVMVTHHDGKPVPKVIDFGIAKATNQKLTEKTLFTRYAHIIGTPAYMSPEQAELSDLDIDTRSDIYSLGVLLYELLTGTTPFSEEELRKAGYVEMQRVIREQEPVKPSTRIRTATRKSQSVGAGSCACPALGGHGGPPLREVRGDLDWIVMKSLEKDRARRYDTASGLAEDVRRHLEHEPVLARGPSTAYRLRKFLCRHRGPTIAALVMLAFAGAAVVVLSLWSRDRLQLAQTHDKEILSQAREQHAKGDRQGALEKIQSIFDSRHVGPEARLLAASILAEDRRSAEAVAILSNLTQERAEIAGVAHSLWARILGEGESSDDETLKQIEEHRRLAQALLPETPEAHFLQATGALTVKEQLAALDQALELDPQHYESLRLRAFTHYASRKYDRLREDARVMTTLHPGDPLGYSLRAIALRELGKYMDALAEYDRALARTPKEDPQYLDLLARRLETLLRMGSYERVIAEAQTYTTDSSPVQYRVFCALTGLGDYEKAEAVFRQIIRLGQESRLRFEDWCGQYVFDTLAAGRSWHPPGPKPAGAVFLAMVEADETYHELSAKAQRVIADGFSARWSPDGKKLAISMGVHGYSGVAVYDPATQETELLVVPGKDPVWSPDGQSIAFVRDCQVLRVPEFATAERKSQHRAIMDEEVWVMKSDGTGPHRLARGGQPCWSLDSAGVYYCSLAERALYSISIAGRDTEPKRIMACSSRYAAVSPDKRRIAYQEDGFLRVKDLDSQGLVAEWPMLNPMCGAPAWSPRGEELCVGMYAGVWNTTGLWIYGFDSREPVEVLDGQFRIRADCWGADGTSLVFHLGPPHYGIWTADLDPKVSTIEALGPGQTLEEHWRHMVRLCTRRIETDPLDAVAYCDRAQCYDRLHERAKAEADMRRWSAAASGRPPRDFRCVLDMPFNCELVFSAERPVNTIPTMSVAFGQKGRCEMKLFEIPMVVVSLVGLGFLTGLDAPPARAAFTFGAPADLEVPTRFFPSGNVFVDSFSLDGREMFVSSGDVGVPGGQGGFDLWVLKQASPEDGWGPPENLGPAVNSASWDGFSSLSADGLELYFMSNRPGGYGVHDIYVTKRATRTGPWGPPANVGPKVSSSDDEWGVSVSSDGLELYFCSTRPGGLGSFDFYVSKRATTSDPWGAPVNLGPAVNSPFNERSPCLSPDGLVLFFDEYSYSGRPGGFGRGDLWMTRRASPTAPWDPAVNLGPIINSPEIECRPCLAPDGSALYFAWDWSDRPNRPWKASILPVVDFNGDSKVDAKDMAVLVDNLGKSNSLCDIGPYPWGDGVVDQKDLGVLMKSLATPRPKALDVLCDAILSWVSPSLAQTCDVYLGTSLEAVNNADRTMPQGVLVSQGQTATTYDPPGLLELSKTYYWRVDFVITGPTPTTIKGPVLTFTTAALTYPIKNITAKASSAAPGSGPERSIDGSGLDKSDGHSTDVKDMWWSQGVAPHWIQYEFDKVYTLHEMWIWNMNQIIEPFIGFGAKKVKIECSTDGTTWSALANVPEFAKGPGKAGYTANTIVNFAGVPAKFVRLTIEKNWSSAAPQTGLSEVRFFCIQSAAVPKP